MQYDHLPDLIDNGFRWASDAVSAILYENATFDPTHTRTSELGPWLKKEPLQGRYVTDDGDFAALPAVFYMVLPDKQYQMVLAYDDGRHDDFVLGFFDEDASGAPIEVQRTGSLFVRPAMLKRGAATYSIWLQPEQA